MGGQRLGNAAEGLVLALCRATPPGPAGKTVIHVFPAWPRDWDAQFTLLARGNFLVTSSMRQGNIEFVEIQSQSGGSCRLRNPWGEAAAVTLFRGGQATTDLAGSLLSFKTMKDETLVLVRQGAAPAQYRDLDGDGPGIDSMAAALSQRDGVLSLVELEAASILDRGEPPEDSNVRSVGQGTH